MAETKSRRTAKKNPQSAGTKKPRPKKTVGKASARGEEPLVAASNAAQKQEASTNPQYDQPSPAEVVGTVAWLMMHDEKRRYAFLSDLEWMVIPPVINRQFRLFRQDGKPFGYAAWAKVSGEVDKELREGRIKLQPGDWTSGEINWLIDFVAPFGGADEMRKALQETVFSGGQVFELK